MSAVAVTTYSPSPAEALTRVRVRTPSPAPHQVLVSVLATTINPIDADVMGGYGAHLLAFTRPLANAAAAGPAGLANAGAGASPLILGREGVGRVVAVGSGYIGGARVGDYVAFAPSPLQCPGAHAEFIALGASDFTVVPAPADDAALARTAAVPYSALTAWAALSGTHLALTTSTNTSTSTGGASANSTGLSMPPSPAAAVMGLMQRAVAVAARGPDMFAGLAALTGGAFGGNSGSSNGREAPRRGPFAPPGGHACSAGSTSTSTSPSTGPRVFIHGGSGPLGRYAAQLLRAQVPGVSIAVSCSAGNAESMRATLGAEKSAVLDYTRLDFSKPFSLQGVWPADAAGAGAGAGAGADDGKVDVFLDCAGGAGIARSAAAAIRPGGVFVTVHGLLKPFNAVHGTSTTTSTTAAAAATDACLSIPSALSAARETAGIAADLWRERGVKYQPAVFAPDAEALQRILALVAEGKVTPVVDCVVRSVEEGFERFAARKTAAGAYAGAGAGAGAGTEEVLPGLPRTKGGKVVILHTPGAGAGDAAPAQ